MNALKRSEKTERRVFDDAAEQELLSLGTKHSRYEDVLDYSYADDRLPEEEPASHAESIASNYRSLLEFRQDAPEETSSQDTANTEEPSYEAPFFASRREAYRIHEDAPVEEADPAVEIDLMPTSTTMQFSEEETDEDFLYENAPVKAKSNSLFRSKAVIVAYAIVIVTLISLIAVNAAVLLRARASVGDLKDEVAYLEKINEELSKDLSGLTDKTTVIENGVNKGMIEGGSSEKMELLTPTNSADVTPDGNWFDSFCNFFDRLFG